MEGRTIRQIAEVLRRPQNTIKSWSRRMSWSRERTSYYDMNKTAPEEVPDATLTIAQPAERTSVFDIRSWRPTGNNWVDAKYLYMMGMSFYKIAAAIERSSETVKTWALRCGWKVEREALTRTGQSYTTSDSDIVRGLNYPTNTDNAVRTKHTQHVRTASGWHGFIEKQAEPRHESAITCIRLIPGSMRLRQGTNGLAAIIRYRMEMDPYNGDCYVFCGAEYTTVKSIQWQYGSFVVMTKKAQHGTFPWPRYGRMAVEITPEEYVKFMAYTGYYD